MALRIALDARDIFVPQRRGTGKNLLDAYRSLARFKPDWTFHLYHQGVISNNPFEGYANVIPRVVRMPGDRWHGWELIRLPLAAWSDGADVLHCPCNSCPRFSPMPMVATVHDLIPLKVHDPDFPHRELTMFHKRVGRCVRYASRIITVSEHSKKDLISDLGVEPHRVDVIPWAPDSAYGPVQDEAELRSVWSRYKIQQPYLLAFSGRGRRKNAEGMIRGFSQLPIDVRRSAMFLIVGVEQDTEQKRLQRLLQEVRIEDRCRIVGFVPEPDVAPLLSGAVGLAYCSLYEGFGLPILDAFRCETPVLTSNVSSMPETAGEAAIYCDPGDPQSIAEGMKRLLGDEKLRKELVRRGIERVRQYSWERTARDMADVFEKCVRQTMHCGVPVSESTA